MPQDKHNEAERLWEAMTVETSVNNATDFAVIDAAARAWISAGGDADGVTYNWHHIRDRVGELE